MGSALPKALIPLGGTPIIRRTVNALLGTGRFSKIVVLAPAAMLDEFAATLAGIDTVRILAGGVERQASVAAAITHLETESPSFFADGSILVHDAARCLVGREIVERCLVAHERYRAVTAAVKIVDTLVRSDGAGRVRESIDRREVFAIQTPQLFDARILRDAHARSTGGATDDASLVAALEPVHLVEGDRFNIKITTPEDLRLGELILGERER